ncbi:hypothetical protein F5Y18DRAFT_426983 [Xylariaceae sp. FL1019]|nr:hypothetical protein F5Y18DRAFT_426983 [Xylariaceae sp. FL1019]
MPNSNSFLSSLIVAVLATAPVPAHAAFGPAWSTGPTASDSFIRESTSTLVIPSLPSNNNGDLSLCMSLLSESLVSRIGMGTSNGDLIQSIVENYYSDTWEVYAYTLLSTSSTTQLPVYSDSTAASAGDEVTMHYTYDDSTGNYTQAVSINGVQVATLSTSDGYAQGYGTAVECAAEDCGTVPAHSWINTEIIMDVADPTYINTMGLGGGATGGEMTTSDGGKTWTVSTINIPEFTF